MPQHDKSMCFVLANTFDVFKMFQGFRLPFKTCLQHSKSTIFSGLRSVFCFPWPPMEPTSIVFSGLMRGSEGLDKKIVRQLKPGMSKILKVRDYFGIRYYVTICEINDINTGIDNIDSILMIYEYYFMRVTRIVSRNDPGIHIYTTQNITKLWFLVLSESFFSKTQSKWGNECRFWPDFGLSLVIFHLSWPTVSSSCLFVRKL